MSRTDPTDPMPAIVREIQEADIEATVMEEMYSNVSFIRGLGDSGRRLELVEYECPACGYDRMVRHWHVNPVDIGRVEYFCNKPSCPHHVEGRFSHARGRRASRPVVPLNEPETWDSA